MMIAFQEHERRFIDGSGSDRRSWGDLRLQQIRRGEKRGRGKNHGEQESMCVLHGLPYRLSGSMFGVRR